jgi:hypothetical protein
MSCVNHNIALSAVVLHLLVPKLVAAHNNVPLQ